MPVQLDLQIANPVLSTHEALRVDCTLRNGDSASRTIPSPYDRSGSFQIGLFDGGEGPVRVMDRRSRQFMMAEGRIDSSLDLDMLAPGATWSWDMDLASYHYAIPPGDYAIRAAYAYEPEKVRSEWGPYPIRVKEDPLQAVTVIRDNPIIDGLTLLMRAEGESGPEYFLRLHNYPRPFGAWWSARIIEGEAPDAPFCASANFYQAQSTDPFHRKWLLWISSNGALRACCYDRGEPTNMVRQASLPEGVQLIRSAVCTQTGELYVFLWTGTDRLQCCQFEQRRLVGIFEREMPCPPGTPISIGANEAEFHITAAWRGILYDRISYSGNPIARQQVFRTRLRPYSIRYEPGERRIKGLFFEGGHGKTVHLAVFSLDSGATTESFIGRLPLRDDLKEMDFDQDRSGRFHLLASTAAGRLYYYSDGRGPILVAEGEDRFFPVMVAPLQVYFGCYRRKYGYRFVQYQRRRQGSKIVGLEAHP